MSTVQVRVKFTSGVYEYIFPHAQAIRDPEAGGKDVIIDGNRADGCIVIPGGKKSIEIMVSGKIIGNDYNDITTEMDSMRTNVVRDIGTLALQHYDSGWQDDWSYSVKRIEPIEFEESLRFNYQDYTVRFLVISYS